MHKTSAMPGVFAAMLALGACSTNHAPDEAAPAGTQSASGSLIGGIVDRAMDRASAKLHEQNITVSSHDDALPKAQITPQGDLLIGGQAMQITAAQRQLLLDYRARVVDIATQGMAIGKQGAALGLQAAGEAIAGAFAGKPEAQIRHQADAQTSGIRQSAVALCDRMPALKAAQQKLADALPAFKPYATMTAHDIDDCHADARTSTSRPTQ